VNLLEFVAIAGFKPLSTCRLVLALALLAATCAAAGASPIAPPAEMVLIPGGRFTMGSSASETSREGVPKEYAIWERPRHEVAIASFLLARDDVTRGEFARFVAETGYVASGGCNVWDGFRWTHVDVASWKSPGFNQTDRDPVVCVNQNDVAAYIGWHSRKMGRSYRLPSEAEWEYAARAGSSTSRYWGDDAAQQCSYANASSLTYGKMFPKEPDVNRACADRFVFTSPVESFRPNGWYLYDMLGDVWQWTADCGHVNYNGAPSDGSPWTTGKCRWRIYRGAGWYDGPWLVRSAMRNMGRLGGRYNGVGFRLAATLTPPERRTSPASVSLLEADRALARSSHARGFVAAYSGAMAPDARKLDAGVPTAIGRSAVLAEMATYPRDLKLDWTPAEAVVAASGDLGYTWGYWFSTSHDRSGKLVRQHGKYLDVWRRQTDGTWRWIADIGN
jgi:formylglycine-generating enzyme